MQGFSINEVFDIQDSGSGSLSTLIKSILVCHNCQATKKKTDQEKSIVRGESIHETTLLNSLKSYTKTQFIGSTKSKIFLKQPNGKVSCVEVLGSFKYSKEFNGLSKIVQHPEKKDKAIWAIREDS